MCLCHFATISLYIVCLRIMYVSFSLFNQLPTMFASSKESKVILGPVVKAGLEALKVCTYNMHQFHNMSTCI